MFPVDFLLFVLLGTPKK